MMNYFKVVVEIRCLSILLFLVPLSVTGQSQEREKKKTYNEHSLPWDTLIKRQIVSTVTELRDFVSIANDAVSAEDIGKNITWAKAAFTKRGFQTHVLQTAKLPLFLGVKNFQGVKQTVLFYLHLDGQAVRADEWQQKNPYVSVLKKRDGAGRFQQIDWNNFGADSDDELRIFGRSVADDKGPIVMLLNALDILEKQNLTPRFNIKVLLDSEEEKGSAGLRASLHNHSQLAQTDYIIVADGPQHGSNRPTITFGNRGGSGFTLTTYGATLQQHSGHFGNYVPDPSFRLARIIASMKDERGRVLIKGFYDDIHLDEKMRKVLAAVPDNKQELNRELGIAQEDLVGQNYQESLQYPSLTIQGLKAAVVGKGAATIIPNEAIAAFGVRLPAESNPERIIGLVKGHITKLGFTVLDHEPTQEERLKHPQIVFFNGRGGSPGYRTEIDSDLGKWLKKALTTVHGSEPVIIRNMGGGVPTIPLTYALKAPAVLLPLVNLDNNQHSPDENLRLGNLRQGIKTYLGVLTTPIR